MLCFPFIGERIKLPSGVSEEFQNATRIISRFSLEAVNERVSPYIAENPSRPALSLSGELTVTALAIMPDETVSFHDDL